MRKQFTRVLIASVGLGLCLLLAAGGYAAGPKDNLVLTILGRWKRINGFGKADPVTVADPYETMGGTMEGQLFYVPALPATDNQRLYRLYNRASDDHRDSLLPGEGDFRAEGTLGFPFKYKLPGTQPMRRDDAGNARLVVAPTTGSQPPPVAVGQLDPAPEGTATGPLLGYGFPRFARNGVSRLTVEGRQVKLTANLVAGGAVSELTWKGKQFINDFDFGRQIQTAVNLSREAEVINPTEGGDLYGFPGTTGVAWAHGSPVLSASVNGMTLRTRCHPLQWKPEGWGGGLGQPVMWLGTFGKRVDMDFGGSPNVMRWITTVNFPSAEPFVNMEAVTAYLNSEFTRFYALNTVTGYLAEMTNLVPNGGCIDPQQDVRLRPPAGGVILATDDGAYALGVYHKGEHASFGLCKFLGYGGSGQYGFSTTKWNLLWRPPQGVQPGPYSITSYLLVGTLNQVVSEARELYRRGR